MKKFNIGVCTIALNESKFASRWAETVADADYVLVTDTGSTDNTISILKKHKIHVAKTSIRPFRFDDARNVALNLLPDDLDIVISLDMDEILMPGWRDVVEREWKENCTRLRYRYVWSWVAPDVPDLIFYGEKISGRHTHRWKNPVHEILSPTVPEISYRCDDILIEHHSDSSKPRSQYLHLLELAVKEDPTNDRNSHYLGREYWFNWRYDDAIVEFKRHLSLPNAKWAAERAASMRYIAKCYECLKDFQKAHEWFTKATLEDPSSREALIDAARFALAQNSFYLVIDYCERALTLPTEGGSYLNERYAMKEGAFDMLAVAHYHIGNKYKAIELAEKAAAMNPYDERLANNLTMMRG